MQYQIEDELIRTGYLAWRGGVRDIEKHGDTGLITFWVHDREFWAKLTPTGKLKKNSIRRNNF